MVYRQEAGGHLHVLAGSRASLRLVREPDRTAAVRRSSLDALAGRFTVRCRARGGEVAVVVPALASWCVRGLDDRFRAAFGKRLRVVPGAAKRS